MSWFGESANVPVTKKAPGRAAVRGNLAGLMDDFFRDWGGSFATFPGCLDETAPPVSVAETDKAYVVEAELPGVKKKDVHVDVSNGLLTIRGEKKAFREEEKDQYYRMERSHGSFMRSVRLPANADESAVSARMEDGVLRVEVPKAADAQRKRTVTVE